MAYTGNVHVSLYAIPDYCNPGAIWASDQENPLQPGGSLLYVYNNASNAFGFEPPFFDIGYYFIGDKLILIQDRLALEYALKCALHCNNKHYFNAYNFFINSGFDKPTF